LVLVNVVVRFSAYSDYGSSPVWIMVLSVIAAVLVSFGASLGGTLVYDYGFNVETAGDHPVWHKSEIDVMPGHHAPAPETAAPPAPAVLEK
jgi:hypothetical protein